MITETNPALDGGGCIYKSRLGNRLGKIIMSLSIKNTSGSWLPCGKLVLIPILAVLIQMLGAITSYSQASVFSTPLEPSEIYRTFYANLSFSAFVMTSSSGSVAVAGSGASGYYFEVGYADLAGGAISRYRFSLPSSPRTMASDGDAGLYYAVGMAGGEVAVYSSRLGGVSYIQASRYSVERLAIGVGGSGDPYLAVLDSMGTLYMYRASRGGWAELGPIRSTAIYNYTEGRVLDISPLEVLVGGARRADPSFILAVYSPPTAILSFNVTNDTGQPVDGAVISAYPVRPYSSIAIQGITDQRGSASLELPILDQATHYVINITHPLYRTESIAVNLSRRDSGQVITYMVVMRKGDGEVVGYRPPAMLSIASILDITGAPEEIRIGRGVILPVKPLAVKLVRPEPAPGSWAYLGIVAGQGYDGYLWISIIYFDRDLNPLRISPEGYVYYSLPPARQAWIGYDDSGSGVMAILSSGKAVYLQYDQRRGYHIAFWSVEIPGGVSAAYYRNGVLIAVDSSSKVHIYRVNPGSSMDCTRGSEYLGIPIGAGVGAGIDPSGNAYISTQNSLYIVSGVYSITKDRCPIDTVRLWAGVSIREPISSYVLSLDGYIYIYERGSLVARSRVVNGSSVAYLPQGEYEALVVSSTIEYRTRISVSQSTADLRGPTLYRVSINPYYTNPESPYTVGLNRVLPGLSLVIDNRTEVMTTDSPVDILIEPGIHSVILRRGDLVLARGSLNIERPGPVDLVLTAELASLNISISILGQSIAPSPGSLRIRLSAEGPLMRGDLGYVRPGEVLRLPLGVYRVSTESVFFYPAEHVVGLTSRSSDEVLNIVLRPKEITVRILVIDDLNTTVPGVVVSLYRKASGEKIFTGATQDDGVITIPGIEFGDYIASLEPSNRSLYIPGNLSLRIDRQDIMLRINRTLQPVIINLRDPISGSLVSPIRITIYMGDKPLYTQDISTRNSNISLFLPHGRARIAIEPASQQSPYSPTDMTREIVVGSNTIEVIVQRRIATVTIRALNDLGSPIQGARITMRSAENPTIELTAVTDSDGKAELRIPYTIYTVETTAQGYNKLETTYAMDRDTMEIRLQPTIINLLMRYTTIYILAGIAASIIIAARILGRYIERKMREEAI